MSFQNASNIDASHSIFIDGGNFYQTTHNNATRAFSATPPFGLFAGLLTTKIDRETADPSPQPKMMYKPHSSQRFTGRRDYLEKLSRHFNSRVGQLSRRRYFLLYGMGGSGKTQICMKFTEENAHR
jgi:hypothetical protein